jgi:nicotinamide riboside kinase
MKISMSENKITFTPENNFDRQVLTELRERNIKSIQLEGGGWDRRTNESFSTVIELSKSGW